MSIEEAMAIIKKQEIMLDLTTGRVSLHRRGAG